ncbi:MAG: ATP-binding protein [Gammaproteobacteria bacterium]|nr:ATP-binding protein [Gammaproteobacteria bacterium]
MKPFDLKPNPRVLLALTHTAMKPIDALCELVDNAIDSFSDTRHESDGVNEIRIDLPTPRELNLGQGAVRVADNGPGMTPEDAEKALTAGYSSQNAYDRLGMFGMGLSIATGKFARKTRLITATKSSQEAVVAEVDLERLVQQGDYNVQPHQHPKNKYFGDGQSGTIIELTGWWPEGNPNKDFPKKLVQYGPGAVQGPLERRYATLLRANSGSHFKIFVKDRACVPFEHCVWAEHRSVTRSGSPVPAQRHFDKKLKTQNRCIECDSLVEGRVCKVDQSHPVRTVDERVRGWVGVQRYEDESHFGIDLIRKGRAICVLEKDAFFTFTDDFGKTIKDYPIDSAYGRGRIVGEVHLDHVRVDFTKHDFDRSTLEWQRAIEFLRGKSSLQARQEGASENDSPVMEIFSGYRRIRDLGFRDMYMGEWKEGDQKPSRVSKETMEVFMEKFNAREAGYFDDAKWWEKVEEASQDPGPGDAFPACPECECQNPSTAEVCSGCGFLLKSKDCSKCGEKIQQSAPKCEHCGHSQVPEGPWPCSVCGFSKNSPDSDKCQRCGMPQGSINVFALDHLLENSALDEDLSEQGIEVTLPGGAKSQKFDLETRIASLRGGNAHLPVVVHPDLKSRKLQVFLDKTHFVFSSMQLQPEHAVAAEAANLIRSESMGVLSGDRKDEYSLTGLQSSLLEKYWQNSLADDPEQTQKEMGSLLEEIRAKMADSMLDMAEEIFNGMSAAEQRVMLMNMQESRVDISEMKELKGTGRFLLYIPPETVISVLRAHPERFFDKTVWKSTWDIPGVHEESVKASQQQLKETYLNCLEDGAGFLRYKKPQPEVVRRAKMSIEFLRRNIAD